MFEIRKFFVRTDRTQCLSEQSADSSEEPTCRSWPNNGVFISATCENVEDFLMKNQIKHQYGPSVSMADL